MTATLPFPAPLFVCRRDDDGLLAWRCPHCEGATVGELDETDESARRDPACCLCRAEFAGMTFMRWRALPLDVRLVAVPPPSDWRSRRACHRDAHEGRAPELVKRRGGGA